MIAAFEKYQADATLENMHALRIMCHLIMYGKGKQLYNDCTDLSLSGSIWCVLVWKAVRNLFGFCRYKQSAFGYIGTEDVYEYGTEYQILIGFISGTCDWITPVKYTEDYFPTITATKKMQLIDGLGHAVPQKSPKVKDGYVITQIKLAPLVREISGSKISLSWKGN
mgnify:FL=1